MLESVNCTSVESSLPKSQRRGFISARKIIILTYVEEGTTVIRQMWILQTVVGDPRERTHENERDPTRPLPA